MKVGIKIPKKDWVLDGYKEPIRKLENGFGYYGVVIRSKDGEYVRSNEDGLFYRMVQNGHLKKFGYKGVKEYRAKYGISPSTPLCGKSISKQQYEKGKAYFHRVGATNLKVLREKGIESNHKRKGSKIALEVRNRRGTCPDQLLDKIRKLEKKLGTVPSTDDFRQEYGTKYMGILYYYFGSWINAVKLAGFKPASEIRPRGFTTEELLLRVKMFFENNGYTPLCKDFGCGILPSVKCYYKHWRTLNAVRLNAGIPLLMGYVKREDRLMIDAGPELFAKHGFIQQ